MNSQETNKLLKRIAEALERHSPQPEHEIDFNQADAFIWQAEERYLKPVQRINYMPLEWLKGIDDVKGTLLENTERFSRGLPANNVLLWGARGMGKSSLVKSVHAHINDQKPHALVLIEIHREDIESLPKLLEILRESNRLFILFCDDLTFDGVDASYKSLKAVLEGGLESRPENVVFYATSNRRHMLPREVMENERGTAINPDEAVEEKVSLSDRFGLWLGFHSCSQETYLEIVDNYTKAFPLPVNMEELHKEALEWAQTRGARSGRVAWQFIQEVSGRMGQPLQLSSATSRDR